MQFVGRIEHHAPSADKDICLYCHERWPCPPAQIKEQVIEKVAAFVAAKATAFVGYAPEAEALRELAEEIKEL